MLLNFWKKCLDFTLFIPFLWSLFSSADKVLITNLPLRSKLLLCTLRKVLFAKNPSILGVFGRKSPFFEVLEFNRHLGINRHFVKNGKNWGVC